MTLSTVTTIANVVGNLVGPVAALVEGLIAAGHSPEEAEAIVRRDIESRAAQIRSDRAERDAQFARKHGEPLGPEKP